MNQDQPSNCTIVTAYYEIEKKKHTSENYYQWISYFLPHCNSPMIIFTDEKSINMINYFRREHLDKTKIFILPMTEFYSYQYLDYWKKDLERDHEKHQHSIELYMIWNEKAMFVKRAIDANPFNTEYFCWSDIGMIRVPYGANYVKNYPLVRKIENNKVYFLHVDYEFTDDDFSFSELASERYRYIVHLGGTVFIGHKDVLTKWIDKYIEMLQEFIKKDFFAGKDQNLMTCVYVKNRDIVQLVRTQPSPFNDEWHYLIYYLCE